MITVNGKEIQMKQSISVAAYLENAGYQMKRIAVELNEIFFRNMNIPIRC